MIDFQTDQKRNGWFTEMTRRVGVLERFVRDHDIISHNPNRLVQEVVSLSASAAGVAATIIPYDDTIPQITEGDQILTLSITPTNVNNRLIIDSMLNVSPSVAITISSALFIGAIGNALSANSLTVAAGDIRQIFVHYEFVPAVTTTLNFQIRAGGSGAVTITYNGTGGARRLGGSMFSYLNIMEVKL